MMQVLMLLLAGSRRALCCSVFFPFQFQRLLSFFLSCCFLTCQNGPSVLLFARMVLGRFLLGLAHFVWFFCCFLVFVFFCGRKPIFYIFLCYKKITIKIVITKKSNKRKKKKIIMIIKNENKNK